MMRVNTRRISVSGIGGYTFGNCERKRCKKTDTLLLCGMYIPCDPVTKLPELLEGKAGQD
jgi:hypothetical protein